MRGFRLAMCVFWVTTVVTCVDGGEAAPSVDELIPAYRGGATKINKPDAVIRKSDDLLEAATAQDAVNAAHEQQREQLAETSIIGPHLAADFIEFGSGVGAVATGLGVFEEYPDLTAARTAKREAFIVAYQSAKANLIQLLRSSKLEKNQELQTRIRRATDGQNSGTALSQSSSGDIKAQVAGLLRGYIVFEVKDEPSPADPTVHQVLVTIAATPRTMASIQRLSAVQIEAASLRDGLQQLMVELQHGLVPPIGARVVDVPATGERAFVGFGSAVLMADEPLAPSLFGDSAAEEAARLVALQSLLELLEGDEVTWQGKIRSRQQKTFQSYEPLVADEPLQPAEPQQVKRLKEQQRAFLAEFEQEQSIRAVGRGRIPAGSITRTWRDQHQGWAYGIVTWLPSTEAVSNSIVQQMNQPAIVDAPSTPETSIDREQTLSQPQLPNRSRVRLPIGPNGSLNRKDF